MGTPRTRASPAPSPSPRSRPAQQVFGESPSPPSHVLPRALCAPPSWTPATCTNHCVPNTVRAAGCGPQSWVSWAHLDSPQPTLDPQLPGPTAPGRAVGSAVPPPCPTPSGPHRPLCAPAEPSQEAEQSLEPPQAGPGGPPSPLLTSIKPAVPLLLPHSFVRMKEFGEPETIWLIFSKLEPIMIGVG